MKISITELKKAKGKIEIPNDEIDNHTFKMTQEDIDLIVLNAIQLKLETGGNDE